MFCGEMKIREALERDLDYLFEIDKKSYGDDGWSKEFMLARFKSFPNEFFVAEENGKPTGFIIFEILSGNETPAGFSNMKLYKPLAGKWMHIIGFTTKTNYKDKAADSKLLLAAENIGKREGCIEAFVPLSKNHPFEENGAFKFWKENGYKKSGEIDWTSEIGSSVSCYFYRKKL